MTIGEPGEGIYQPHAIAVGGNRDVEHSVEPTEVHPVHQSLLEHLVVSGRRFACRVPGDRERDPRHRAGHVDGLQRGGGLLA